MPFAWVSEDGNCTWSEFRQNLPTDADVFEVPSDFRTCVGTLYRREGNDVVPDVALNQARRLQYVQESLSTSSAEWRNGDSLPDPLEVPAEVQQLHYPSRFADESVAGLEALGCQFDRACILHIVNSLFYASLEQEEGRFYSICIEVLNGLHDRDAGGDYVAFERPIQLTPQALIKLAPALDPSQSSLHVMPGSPAQIVGISTIYRSLNRWVRNDSHAGYSIRHPRGPLFKCRGPGHLVSELGAVRISEFKRGLVLSNFTQVFSDDGPVKRFLEAHKVLSTSDLMSIRDPIHRLIARLASSGDGAIVAVVGMSDLDALTAGRIVTPGISVGWSRMEAVSHRHRMLESLDQARDTIDQWKLEAVHQEFEGVGAPLADAARQLALTNLMIFEASLSGNVSAYESHSQRLPQCQIDYADAISAIKHLACPDGALLIGASLNVLSFASKITNVEDVDVYRALDAAAISIERFSLQSVGTRHRSAVWLASRLPNSCVFVISEDGLVSATKQWRGRVVIWRPVITDRFQTVDRSN